MSLHATSRKIEVPNLTISNQEGSFKLNVDIHKVEKNILLAVPNPECKTFLHLTFILEECSLMPMIPKQN